MLVKCIIIKLKHCISMIQVYSLLDQEGDETDAKPLTVEENKDVPILDFTAATAAVLENAGKVSVKIKRHGKTSGVARCRFVSI